MRFYRDGFVVEEKLGADNFSEPVTEADRAASLIIVNGLRGAFPDDGILSEEETDTAHRLDKSRAWFVDPIDGTSGFIDKTGDFAIQIGLAINGESALGVVYQPLDDKMFYAAKDSGAWLETINAERRKLQVSTETDFRQMTMAISRSHRSPRMSEVVARFQFKRELARGSVGVKIGLLALQEADVYIHLSPRTKHWDTCAPEIILREAGGETTDLFGARLVYNTSDVQNHNGVVASNGAAHDSIINTLKPLLAEFGRVKPSKK